ncbi:RNA-directed DNA polymerase, eukaryota, partial [Tanacetum coccineum]
KDLFQSCKQYGHIVDTFIPTKRSKTGLLWLRAKEVPGWVPDFTDENDDEELNDEVSKEGELKIHEACSYGEDSEVEEVMETMLNKKEVIVENEKNSGHSLKYPPGFTPKEGTDATGMNVEESRNDHTVKLSDRIRKSDSVAKHKEELEAFEEIIDKGNGNEVDLERDVSNEEIKRAVWDCGTEKSPGLDGFSFGFYRRFWYLIENDVYDAVKHFFTYGVIPKGCNSSFIALIPKSQGANTVKDFRPISLIGSVYKIIAKILANRLVGVLGDIVNEAIHGDDGKVGGYVKDGAKSCWLVIVNETHTLKNKGINLLDFLYVKLGNGDKTAFWEDHWIEGSALKTRWNWALESSGDFSVASVRKAIDDKLLPEVNSKTRWIKYVPIKVNVHTWKVKTDSLPTRFNISRQGIDIESITCAICEMGGDVYH